MKRALSVGINYPGTGHSLRGCVNDSYMIEALLRDQYGFEDITLLLDNDATTENIRTELNKLVAGARPGDILFFHYSGHGSQLPDKGIDDDDEPDGLDEIICPVDLDWKEKVIRDDELKAIFDKVPNGVNLTVFLDCCNSGGGMDALNEYQSLAPGARSVDNTPRSIDRYLPPPADVIKFAAQRRLTVKTRSVSRKIDHSALMISGCQSQQTSADAFIDGEYRGAATYFLNNTLTELGYDSSYLDTITKLNKDIAAAGFTQRPQLDGPEKLHTEAFLSDYSDLTFAGDGVTPIEADPTPTPAPQPTKDDDEKNNTLKLILAAGVIGAIIYFITQGGV